MPSISQYAGQFNCPTGFIHTTHSSGEDYWVRKGCRQIGCPDCWASRAMKARLEIVNHLVHHHAKNLWLWTTSVRNSVDLPNSFEALSEAETRFRKADYMKKKRGQPNTSNWIKTWIGVYEVKRSKDLSWNVHSHKIVVGSSKFIGPRRRRGTVGSHYGYGFFDAAWKAAAQDPQAHSDFLGPSHDAISGSRYLTKYLGKDSGIWGSMSVSEAVQFGDCLRGRRFLRRPRGSKPPDVPSPYVYCCETVNRESCWYDSDGRF